VPEAGKFANRLLEEVKAPRTRVAFITDHHSAPLGSGHRRRTAISQEVDKDVVGVDEEGVVVSGGENRIALFGSRPANRLDNFDAKRLDNL
jgi:hypothetical protein